MTSRLQYQLFIAATIVISLYVLGTEVLDRWKDLFQLHDDYLAKEQTLLEPADLAARKLTLLERKQALAKQLAARSQTYEQTQSGLMKFLNSQARACSFRFESLVPKELRSTARMKENGLTIDFQARYHQVGAFVNALETGPFPLEIDRADLTAKEPGGQLLQVRLEGRVALPKGIEP